MAVATDFFGTLANQAFAFHWDGRVVFSVTAHGGHGPPEGRLALVARWTNRNDSGRFQVPRETLFEFATDLPGDALDRIESFRDGGRLYARLEGRLFVIYRDEHVPKSSTTRPWVDDAVALLGQSQRTPCADVSSEVRELTRDVWCTEVLATLRPPGRFVFDVRVPIGDADEEGAKRALAHLAEAQKTFDEGGRDGEVGRICYRALDELRRLADHTEKRYGMFGRDRLIAQIKETKSLCDPERHGDSPHHDDLKFDRPLAQHVLVVTSSIAGVLLR